MAKLGVYAHNEGVYLTRNTQIKSGKETDTLDERNFLCLHQ